MSALTTHATEIDTIVVAARDTAFKNVFLTENRWHEIRIHSDRIPKIKHIAVYRVKPIAAITHVAPVQDIRRCEGSSKYMLIFAEPAKQISPIKLVPGGHTKAPQAPRYTSIDRLMKARTLEEVF